MPSKPTIVKRSAPQLLRAVWDRQVSSRSRRIAHGLALALALGCLAVGACSKFSGAPDEMSWARGALERNGQLSVVAADPKARTFTVKVKDTGKLRVIPVDQIVAGVPPTDGADAAVASQTPSEPSAPSAGTATTAAASTPGVAGGENTMGQSDHTASAAAEEPQHSDTVASVGEPAQSDEGASAPAPNTPAGPHAESAANATAGHVLATGPGYTIKASGPKSPTAGPSPVTAARGTPVERLHDPIICQGSRMLHIDNRNLQFDGDAVSAQDGCEIHITNTHIAAKGVGVLARAANVYLDNSEIEGESGAIDASEGAQIYAESSHFRGLTRRMNAADFHDLGGNVWN